MFKFFRNIRQNLLSEGKTGKYFKYAIGEILLVVIGILIALQVSNWNNQKAQDKKTIAILNQIIDELVIDVDVIKDANGFYLYKDSVINIYENIALENIPKKSDTALDERNLIHMIRTFAPVEIHDRGFNLLMSHTDQIDEGYNEYISELVYLYEDWKPAIEMFYGQLKTVLYEHRMHQIKNYAWYSRIHINDQVNREEIEYYKYDPIYKNYVKYYNEMIYNLVLKLRLFEDLAIKFCRKANKDFNLGRDIDKELSFKYPPKELLTPAIIGKYLFDNKDTLSFSNENGQLYESTYENTDLVYIYERQINVGELRYLGGGLFYRNTKENLRIDTDGNLYVVPIKAGRKPILLERIRDD